MKYILTIVGGVLTCYGFAVMATESVTWMLHPTITFGAMSIAAGLILDAAES